MNFRRITSWVCIGLTFGRPLTSTAAENLTNAIHSFLVQRIAADPLNAGIVVGLVDESGSRIIHYGKLDNGTEQEVDGNSLFEIGSITKTFTALLLQEMAERGDMKLDDPATKYLPKWVNVPTRNKKKITLRHLATHTSGLPGIPDNLSPKRADNPYADYTVDQLYHFLSGYKLIRDPGAASEYSNLGMGLLGHVIETRSGTNYESLVVDRICQPLKMESTRITLSPELQARLAIGHDLFGEITSSWDIPVLAGAGALRSTANDLLKYVSANLGLTRSILTVHMKKTYENGLAWGVQRETSGMKIVSHSGGTGGYQSFIGFDLVKRRGVVILFNGRRVIDGEELGNYLLKGNSWESNFLPLENTLTNSVSKLFSRNTMFKLEPKQLDAIVGQYEFAPGAGSPPFPGMKLTIWREEDRLVGQTLGAGALPGAFVIYPESETSFVIKVTGARLLFNKDDKGEVTTVIHHETGIPDLAGKRAKRTKL